MNDKLISFNFDGFKLPCSINSYELKQDLRFACIVCVLHISTGLNHIIIIWSTFNKCFLFFWIHGCGLCNPMKYHFSQCNLQFNFLYFGILFHFFRSSNCIRSYVHAILKWQHFMLMEKPKLTILVDEFGITHVIEKMCNVQCLVFSLELCTY